MMPWVTQQLLQYTTCGRYQPPCSRSGRHDPKRAEGKLETLLNKFVCGWLRRSSFGRESVRTAGWAANIQTELLTHRWQAFHCVDSDSESTNWNNGLLQHTLSCRYSKWIYFGLAVNADKTVCMTRTALLQIVSMLKVILTQLHRHCLLNGKFVPRQTMNRYLTLKTSF